MVLSGIPKHLMSLVCSLRSRARHSPTKTQPQWPRFSQRTRFWWAPDGIFSGRQAIEKRYEDTFQRRPFTLFNDLRDCHLNAIDNAVWSFGEWGGTLQDQTGPVFVKGYFSSIYVREGDAWKIRMLTLTEHPRTAPSAETKEL